MGGPPELYELVLFEPDSRRTLHAVHAWTRNLINH
jgi:hypothetical protein